MMSAFSMDMPMLQFYSGGGAYSGNHADESQRLASQRMISVYSHFAVRYIYHCK